MGIRRYVCTRVGENRCANGMVTENLPSLHPCTLVDLLKIKPQGKHMQNIGSKQCDKTMMMDYLWSKQHSLWQNIVKIVSTLSCPQKWVPDSMFVQADVGPQDGWLCSSQKRRLSKQFRPGHTHPYFSQHPLHNRNTHTIYIYIQLHQDQHKPHGPGSVDKPVDVKMLAVWGGGRCEMDPLEE